MESLNRAPESGAIGSFAGNDLSRFGRIEAVKCAIDLTQMFDKSNYGAFVAQSAASEMADWTGVPLTVDEPIGEFAACIVRHGQPHEVNLAFAGKFNSMWGKSDLLLMVTDEDDKRLLVPGIGEDEKIFSLVCSANALKPQESVVASFMAIMEPWYYHDVGIPTTNIAYTMLFNAHLSTLL